MELAEADLYAGECDLFIVVQGVLGNPAGPGCVRRHGQPPLREPIHPDTKPPSKGSLSRGWLQITLWGDFICSGNVYFMVLETLQAGLL